MAQVLIRNLDEKTLEIFRRRAQRTGTSLERELRKTLDEVAGWFSYDAYAAARRFQRRMRRKGVRFSDSGKLLAKDRERWNRS